MGTRAKIEMINDQKKVLCMYLNMDGHIENWSTELTNILEKYSKEDIITLRKFDDLLEFFTMYNPDNMIEAKYLDYYCKIDISNDEFNIEMTEYNKITYNGDLAGFKNKFVS